MKIRVLAPPCAALLLLACAGKGSNDKPKQKAAPPSVALGRISGRVTNKTNAIPVPGAVVTVQRPGTLQVMATTTADAQGVYALERMPLDQPLRIVTQGVAGSMSYHVQASAPVTLDKAAPARSVDLACQPADESGHIEIRRPARLGHQFRFTLAQDVDVPDGRTSVAVRTEGPGTVGVVRFNQVPAGTYLLHVAGPDQGRGPCPIPSNQRKPLPPIRSNHHSVPVVVKGGEIAFPDLSVLGSQEPFPTRPGPAIPAI
jgi:hypothetical protein